MREMVPDLIDDGLGGLEPKFPDGLTVGESFVARGRLNIELLGDPGKERIRVGVFIVAANVFSGATVLPTFFNPVLD